MRKRIICYFVLVMVYAIISGCSGTQAGGYEFEVTFRKDMDNILVPVVVELPPDIKAADAVWTILPKGVQNAEPANAQIWNEQPEVASGGGKLVFLWNPGTVTGESKQRFVLRKESAQEKSDFANQTFAFEDHDNKFLTLKQDGTPVMTYVYGMNLKEDVPEDRTRACYIHPLYGLDGEALTDDFPGDHYHHRGMYVAWPLVIVNGDSLDLWHIDGIEKRFERWLTREDGPVYARLGVQSGWYAGEKKVVDERMWVAVFRAGSAGRVIDFNLTLEALETPVTLVGSPSLKGYGGFNYRPAPFENPVITTCEGVQADSNLRRFPWADFSANFGGRETISGVAIFVNDGNPNTPNGWTLRHYGFLGVAWPGNNPYLLQPGKPYRARYRVWLHRGDAENGRVSSAYSAYAFPPQVKFIK